ncbi:hypothetical protein LB465_17190 [Salegentibacter sp. LM13S]|uniref:hypothetical protein n=1 Tax=Salegentibacter lacus TaxID=2873599 RepID=UPI001CCC2D70|nr:hypothetical protein [Salegentibacter lacus]MBZ9632518.1 hypothetical protein [Salegentibacter lacus]
MELKDLVGEHELSGVEISTVKVKQYGDYYEDTEVIMFVIDGKTYKATEDPDDGYRSYLKELEVTEEKVANSFPPQKVVGKMKKNSTYDVNDTIQFIDAVTEKIVLEVGTDNTDDYYPYCVLYWNPENLAINAGK